jgi:hydroxylamine reductase (hybrid-cluster protein)
VEKKGTVPESIKELLLDSTFATLTNVNFDSNRFYGYLKRANAAREALATQAVSLGVDPRSLSGPAHFKYSVRSQYTLKIKLTN